MRLFKPKEQKLREQDGRSAAATVLERRATGGVVAGASDSAPSRAFRYRLRVEPEGEAPFEAEATINERDVIHEVGDATFVIYDPADLSRVAIDQRALQARGVANLKAAVPAGDMLAKLTALRDRGGISDADFEKAKARLIDG